MTDCSELMAKLNSIEAAINGLDSRFILKSERGGIVNEGGNYGKQLAVAAVVPMLGAYTLKTVHEADFGAAFRRANEAWGLGKKAEGDAIIAKSIAEMAEGTAQGAQRTATTAKRTADVAEDAAATAFRKAQEAYALGDKALGDAIMARSIAEMAEGTAQGAQRTATTASRSADEAKGLARAAQGVADEAKSVANGAKNAVRQVGDDLARAVSRIDDAIGRLSSRIGDAMQTALRAIGLSDEALRVGGRALKVALQVLGKVLIILDIISAIMSIVNQIDLRNRMNALERRMSMIESEVSRLLGRLFTFISKVEAALARMGGDVSKAIQTANEARRVAGDALSQASNAQATATSAQSLATQAKNIALGNMAQIAITTGIAIGAQGLAQRALQRGMTPGPRGLQGARGINGLNGRNGLDGKNGLNGMAGKNGLNGKNGVNGQNGRHGLNGARGQQGPRGANGVTTVVYRTSGSSSSAAANAATNARVNKLEAENRMNNGLLRQIRSAQVGHIGVSRATLALGTAIQATTLTIDTFMKTAWKATRMDKVLNALTFLAVLHNVSLLSRDVGETFFYLITSSLQMLGVRDEEDQVIDVQEVVGEATTNFLKRILGEDVYNNTRETYLKANRILQSASSIIWTIRSIADSSADLMEWIGEHTGKIGNALKRWGVVGERSYPWMSERPQQQGKWRSRFQGTIDTLENVEDRISVWTQASSNVIEIQEETNELFENWERFQDSVTDAAPKLWPDNQPVKAQHEANKAVSNGTEVLPAEAQKG